MINLLSKFKKSTKTFHAPSVINPHKHWAVLLSVFFFVIICLILFSFYLLFQIRNDQVFKVKPVLENTQTELKETSLKDVTELFNQKAIKNKDLIDSPKIYTDPSL